MHPDNQDKILDILFDCGNTVGECVSFERNFTQKRHPAIIDRVLEVQNVLFDQYIRVLELVSNIQRSFNDVKQDHTSSREHWKNWLKVRGQFQSSKSYSLREKCTADNSNAGHALLRDLTGKITDWESKAKEIKWQHRAWTTKRKEMEDRLLALKNTTEVRKWIQKDGDPEPGLDTIKARVMPDGRYENAAEWFLKRPEFQDWRDNFRNPKRTANAKRVLWLQGTYGTGKTTLLYHTYSDLGNDPDTRLRSFDIRIVPYFCDASGTESTSTRPDYETIHRALIWHLSLLPDSTLADEAQEEYNKATS